MLYMKRVIWTFLGLVLAGALVLPGLVTAEADPLPQHNQGAPSMTPPPDPLQHVASEPVCVAIPIFSADTVNKDAKCPGGYIPDFDDRGGPIVWYIIEVLKLFSLIIGGIIVLVLVLAGINYITSAGDPNGVKTAKKRIQNAITALILFMMMYAILNFLIPGGIFIGG